MAFQELPDMDCEVSFAIGGFDKKARKDNPTTATGYFIGSKQVPSKKSKTGFAFLHIFQKPGGDNFGVWGKTDLDRKMRAVEAGQLTKISFVGMKETENNPMYKYKVQVDKEDTIEVTTTAGNEPQMADSAGVEYPEGSYDEEPQDEADLDEEEAQPDEAPPVQTKPPRQAAKPPTGEAQRRVQELTNKGKARQAA